MLRGTLPIQDITKLIKDQHIVGADTAQVQPASLDLSLSQNIYRIEQLIQPRTHETIESLLSLMGARKHEYANPLERDVMYLAQLNESLKLPPELYARCNPKSSTGRNDVQVRILTDGVARFDTATPGYNGSLWIVIMPKSYPIVLSTGETLAQIRFFYYGTSSRLAEEELRARWNDTPLLYNTAQQALTYSDIPITDHDGSLILSADLAGNGVVAWECLGINTVLDFSKRNFYSSHDFFQPIHAQDGMIHLRQHGFYILRTAERVCVPNSLACEMVPMDERSGEFRSHYAGFIDPGWGWGADGSGTGRPLVLEVRPFESVAVRDQQPIAKIVFDIMNTPADISYDAQSDSHYRDEPPEPRLSKHFLT